MYSSYDVTEKQKEKEKEVFLYMNFIQKLEQKWGRYAIYNFQKYVIIAYFIGFALNYIAPGVMSYLQFSVPAILQGQIWRLVTWVFCGNGSGIFTILFLLCLFPMGQQLERFIGTFGMNVYLIGGMLLNVVGGILVYVVSYLILGVGLPVYLTNYYILLSMFMALALCMPEATVHLYFLIPIKMKWMLVIYLVELAYEIYVYYSAGGIIMVAILGTQVILALLNLFLFFHLSKIRLTRKQKKVQREFHAQMASTPRPGSGITRHKCVICGRTEVSNPELMFRYCSKCTGNKEYCQDHLFTHTHN